MYLGPNEERRRQYLVGDQIWLGGHEPPPERLYALDTLIMAIGLSGALCGSLGFLLGLAL